MLPALIAVACCIALPFVVWALAAVGRKDRRTPEDRTKDSLSQERRDHDY